jgi:hypothetical protein
MKLTNGLLLLLLFFFLTLCDLFMIFQIQYIFKNLFFLYGVKRLKLLDLPNWNPFGLVTRSKASWPGPCVPFLRCNGFCHLFPLLKKKFKPKKPPHPKELWAFSRRKKGWEALAFLTICYHFHIPHEEDPNTLSFSMLILCPHCFARTQKLNTTISWRGAAMMISKRTTGWAMEAVINVLL